jgi:hypothetical protein
MVVIMDDLTQRLNSQLYNRRLLAKTKYHPNKVQQIRADAKLNKNVMPFFRYHLLDMKNINFRWITDGNYQIHRITDSGEFYRLLGYTEEMRQSGLEPEVFVWQDYHKDNCLKTEACLQANIINFLNIYSEKFQNEYISQYANWRGSCKSVKIRDTLDCTDCKMHPLNKFEK